MNYSKSSSDLYVATMMPLVRLVQSLQFLDGLSGTNLISASADQFMCFTGSEIRCMIQLPVVIKLHDQ